MSVAAGKCLPEWSLTRLDSFSFVPFYASSGATIACGQGSPALDTPGRLGYNNQAHTLLSRLPHGNICAILIEVEYLSRLSLRRNRLKRWKGNSRDLQRGATFESACGNLA